MDVLDYLRRLVGVPGVSGYEDRVRRVILDLASWFGRPRVDNVGNVVLDMGGRGSKVVLAAHMDELGLVVTDITEEGLLRFRKIGGIDDRVLPSTHVIVHTGKGDLPGVIGITPPHLQLDREQRVIPWSELFIDVGASSRGEAEEMGVSVLDPVSFQKPWTTLAGGSLVATRAIDDRMGCAALLKIAEMIHGGEVKPRNRVVLAWTVQEEVGLRGAMALAQSERPSLMIAVDTMACCNPQITGPVKPGKGPVIRALDNAYIGDLRAARRILEVARASGIPVQVATAGGGTDAAAFQRVGVRSLAIGVPVKYTHSTVEVMNVGDYRSLVDLLARALEEHVAG